MKTNSFKSAIAIAAVTLVTSYGISKSVNNSSTELSDLTLTNIEALATGEANIKSCLAAWGKCVGEIKAPYVEAVVTF